MFLFLIVFFVVLFGGFLQVLDVFFLRCLVVF